MSVPVKPLISMADLEKIDVRVGTIEQVEDIAGADRLVRLTVDFGDHRRRVVAGIKGEREDPGEIRGRQALFVVNLEPRTIRGEISEGMVGQLQDPFRGMKVPRRAGSVHSAA